MSSVARQPPLIAHVITELDVGGLENGVVNLVNLMPRARYRHAIVCLRSYSSFRQRIARDDVEVFALNKKPGKDVGNYARLWRLFRSLRPNIVHTRNLGALDAVVPAKLAGVPALVHGEHGWDVHDVAGKSVRYRLLRWACSRLIDRQVAVSRHIASWLEETVHISAARISQIYNGVDTLKFHPPAAGRVPLPLAGFAAPDSFVIGAVGRMAAIKDPMTVVHAFRRLRETLGADGERLRLVIVGDGPLLEDVKQALASCGMERATWLAGRRDDIAEILRGLDMFVLSSRNEGISNTILEAMATGLPVVATDVGGNPELVIPERTGVIVPPADPAAIAAAARRYFETPALGKAHGTEGRRRACEHFSMEAMVSKYLEVYDLVMQTERGATRQ